jgi:hypothetical protein
MQFRLSVRHDVAGEITVDAETLAQAIAQTEAELENNGLTSIEIDGKYNWDVTYREYTVDEVYDYEKETKQPDYTYHEETDGPRMKIDL